MSKTNEGKQLSCCSSSYFMTDHENERKTWNLVYFAIMSGFIVMWCLTYWWILPISNWLVFDLFGFDDQSKIGDCLQFFIYDTIKILLLLVGLIYAIAWIRASLNIERVRHFLIGKHRGIGYGLGALFGAITPFCSCSSIPFFLGFASAGIPIGITLSFLITSPLVNEIAIVLLWNMLGWKLTIIYVMVGMTAGVVGGFFMDSIKADRWLQPFVRDTVKCLQVHEQFNETYQIKKLTVRQRHLFAYGEMADIFKRVWKWIIIGVGIGAALHGYVPRNWFTEHFSADHWWSAPSAVLVGIPLYTNVTGIVPIMESLLVKGLPLGTTLAFCMSAVAASIPEVIMLRQIMTIKLQMFFIGYLWFIFTMVGWLFNALQFQLF